MRKLKVVILTCHERGYASRTIPIFQHSQYVKVTKVVLAKRFSKKSIKEIIRKFKKVLRIGILGALNGIRIRYWFKDHNSDKLVDVCSKFKIEIVETDLLQSEETANEILSSKPDIGLSLGNSYIPERIFSIPRFGFLNIHSEVLPQYQNAQSIIWPIYDNQIMTGFTIHKVEKKIDVGDILYQEKYPIIFCKSLSETVQSNINIAFEKAPIALKDVCEKIEYYLKNSSVQLNGKSYTTPTIIQFITMIIKNKNLYNKYSKIK